MYDKEYQVAGLVEGNIYGTHTYLEGTYQSKMLGKRNYSGN